METGLSAADLEAFSLAIEQFDASQPTYQSSPVRASPASRPTTRSSPAPREALPVGLPDYLDDDLDIIFVGDNPGLTSARNQKWYAHSTNHFWSLLHDSGFLPTPLTHVDDHQVLQHKIGLTCLCSRPTRGTDELTHEELAEGLQLLKAKLERYRPKAICFNGMGIYQSVTGTKGRVGYQGDYAIVPGVSVFVMPSSSARVKHYTYDQKVSLLRDIKAKIDAKRGQDRREARPLN